MTTLTDLRRTLEQHADDVPDPLASARTTAVQHRVAVVRRRRRAVGTGVLALVLVAAAAVGTWSRGSDRIAPSGPTLLGDPVPAWQKSLGFRYDLAGRGETFSGSGTLQVQKSDEPQLFSWTMGRGTRVAITLPDHRTWYSSLSHFDDWVVIQPGESGPLRFSDATGGDVAVASYRLAATPLPPGYSADGITFRQDVAGSRLLRGLVMAHGATGATTTYPAPHGQAKVALACSGVPKGDAVHFSVNGRPGISTAGPCGSNAFWDAGSGTTYGLPGRYPPHSTLHLRVWLTAGLRDQQQIAPGSVPGLRIAFGVYGPAPTERVGGQRVPEYVEDLGHTWMQSTGQSSSPGVHASATLFPYGNGRVVVVAWTTHGQTRVSYQAQGSTGSGSSGPGPGQLGDLWDPARSTAVAKLVHGTGRIGIVAYTPDD
jgi:hypothetical protein